MLGQSFIKVVINMFSNIQVNGVNPMILAMTEDGIDMKDLMILQMMQGSNDGQIYAPIVQRIEYRPPKSGIQVQVLLGAHREL